MERKDYIIRLFFVFFFALGVSAVFLVLGDVAFAQEEKVPCTTDAECTGDITGWENARCVGDHCVEVPAASQQLPEGPGRAQDVLDLLDLITDWIFAIAMTIALIFLIMAAFQFVTGGGDPAKVNEARQKLLYAVIGIGVAFVSAGFVRVIAALVK